MASSKRLLEAYENGDTLDLEDQLTALLASGDAEDKKRKSKNGGKRENGKQQTDDTDNR